MRQVHEPPATGVNHGATQSKALARVRHAKTAVCPTLVSLALSREYTFLLHLSFHETLD